MNVKFTKCLFNYNNIVVQKSGASKTKTCRQRSNFFAQAPKLTGLVLGQRKQTFFTKLGN